MPDSRRPARLRPARLARAAAREEGYVIMVAVAMLAIALAIGAAALGETLSSRSHADRDARVKRALQAADAGIGAMLYQQNELPLKNLEWNGGVLGLSTLVDCVVPTFDASLKVTGVTTASVDANNVCPDSSGAGHPASGSISLPVGDHAYYQARFIPGAAVATGGYHTTLSPKIVSVGFDDGGNASNTGGYTVRRVEAILAPLDPFQAIEAMGDLKISGITVGGISVASTLNGNARANDDVTLPTVFLNTSLNNSLGSPVLGTVTYGGSHNGGPLIPLSNIKKQTSSFTRAPISVASTKSSCPAADATIPRLANCADLGAAYNSVTNTFSLGSGTVNIPPGDYVFCNFNATGGTVSANATAAAPVRIFIDSSKSTRCSGNGLGSAQGNFNAANGIGNLLGNTLGATGASGLQIYVVGDQAASPYDNATSLTIGAQPLVLGSGVIQNYVVYAPTSSVNLSNCITVLFSDVCAAIQGAVIGDNVTVKASVFTQDLDLSSYSLYPGLGAFHVQSYVECPPVYPMPTPDPTSGC